MEKAQNGSADDNAEHVAASAPLLVDSEDPAIFIDFAQEENDAMENNVSEESSETHDEPVDVIGGEDEFAFVSKSGLPVTSLAEQEKEDQEQRDYDAEIPTITNRLSRGSVQGGKAPSLMAVEFTRNPSRQPSMVPHKKHGLQGLSDKKKHALGLFLITVHCLTIVASSQFAKATYATDFSAPFFLVYFRTFFRIIIFPAFMVLKYIHRVMRNKGDRNVSFMKTFYSCTSVFGPDGLTFKSLCYPCGLLATLWLIVQFAHVLAVKYLNNSVTQALFCSETAFCYLLSALILKVPVYVMKVIAVMIALSGVGFMAYSQSQASSLVFSSNFTSEVAGLNSSNQTAANLLSADGLRWEGVAICLAGAFLGSSYMVAVKKTIGKSEDVGQALLLTSAMSVFVTVTCWPIALGLWYSKVEFWNLATFPWGMILASSSLTLVSISIFNLCLTLTSPLLMTLSKLMGIPVNYLIDWIVYNHKFDVYQVVGVILIGVGFVFIALPERWLAIKKIKGMLRRRKSVVSPPMVTVTEDPSSEAPPPYSHDMKLKV